MNIAQIAVITFQIFAMGITIYFYAKPRRGALCSDPSVVRFIEEYYEGDVASHLSTECPSAIRAKWVKHDKAFKEKEG